MVQYVYDAWGNHAVLDANGNDLTDTSHIGNRNPFRYRGYFYDVETGLYYLQTRYYDPEVGRFLNMDDISYADPEQTHGLNLYAYCANNPVNYVDAAGLFPISLFGSGVDFLKDIIFGIGREALRASSRAFAALSVIPQFIIESSGNARFNPAYLLGMKKATRFDYFGKVLTKSSKILGVASYILLAADIGLSIYNNVTNPNLSTSRKITDSIVDVAFSAGGFFLSLGAGALIGSIGGPIGMVLGAFAALAVNVGIWAFQSFGTMYNDLKESFNTFVTVTIPNMWNNFVDGWNNFWSFNWI